MSGDTNFICDLTESIKCVIENNSNIEMRREEEAAWLFPELQSVTRNKNTVFLEIPTKGNYTITIEKSI